MPGGKQMIIAIQKNEPVKKAVIYTGDNKDEIIAFMRDNGFKDYEDANGEFGIRTLKKYTKIEKGDYVVKDGYKYISVIKEEQFKKEYQNFIPYVQFIDTRVKLIPFSQKDVNDIISALGFVGGQFATVATNGIQDPKQRSEEIFNISSVLSLNIISVAIDILKKQGIKIDAPERLQKKEPIGDA